MGYFAATCGISGAGINENERVVIIVLNLPYKFVGMNDLITRIDKQLRDLSINYKEWREEYVKTCIDQTSAQAIKHHKLFGVYPTLFDFKPVKEVLSGTYNDCGFIKESEYPEIDRALQYGNDNGMQNLLFHTWAVEHLFQKKIEDLTLDLNFASALIRKIYFLRRSCIDLTLGQQHPDIDEMQQQIAMNEKTNEFLRGKIDWVQNKYPQH